MTTTPLPDYKKAVAKIKADLRTLIWMTAAILVMTSILFVKSFFFSA